jgi:hypothetical protein
MRARGLHGAKRRGKPWHHVLVPMAQRSRSSCSETSLPPARTGSGSLTLTRPRRAIPGHAKSPGGGPPSKAARAVSQTAATRHSDSTRPDGAPCWFGRTARARRPLRRTAPSMPEQSSRPPWRRGCYRTRAATPLGREDRTSSRDRFCPWSVATVAIAMATFRSPRPSLRCRRDPAPEPPIIDLEHRAGGEEQATHAWMRQGRPRRLRPTRAAKR